MFVLELFFLIIIKLFKFNVVMVVFVCLNCFGNLILFWLLYIMLNLFWFLYGYRRGVVILSYLLCMMFVGLFLNLYKMFLGV